mmetsp:Transcript_14203/g.56621  ORF Transcript_14203/g.56621 Transcript_14203/m.56621 type:complete len:258 (+) Transcript_14203:621-1394(+)
MGSSADHCAATAKKRCARRSSSLRKMPYSVARNVTPPATTSSFHRRPRTAPARRVPSVLPMGRKCRAATMAETQPAAKSGWTSIATSAASRTATLASAGLQIAKIEDASVEDRMTCAGMRGEMGPRLLEAEAAAPEAVWPIWSGEIIAWTAPSSRPAPRTAPTVSATIEHSSAMPGPASAVSKSALRSGGKDRSTEDEPRSPVVRKGSGTPHEIDTLRIAPTIWCPASCASWMSSTHCAGGAIVDAMRVKSPETRRS